MRVLVTGGLGFLGHAVVADLRDAGHHVTVMSRNLNGALIPAGVNAVAGDVRDRQRMRDIATAGGYDAVVHLAALARARDSVTDPLAYWDVNVAGTLNLLQALPRTTRLVFASTNVVYGSRTVGALSEDLDPHPESPYAATKLACEHLIDAHAATGALSATSLRLFNIAGAADGVTDTDTTRIVPNALRAAAGELPHVTLNGDGTAVRDFVHVADCATAVRLALEAGQPGHRVYNVGSGVGTSMADVVACAEKVTDRPVPVVKADPKSEPHTLVADISRIRSELGWRPERSALEQIVADGWAAWRHLPGVLV